MSAGLKMHLAGHRRPAGRVLETPAIGPVRTVWYSAKCFFMKIISHFLNILSRQLKLITAS